VFNTGAGGRRDYTETSGIFHAQGSANKWTNSSTAPRHHPRIRRKELHPALESFMNSFRL
jgi:hypothetical protein